MRHFKVRKAWEFAGETYEKGQIIGFDDDADLSALPDDVLEEASAADLPKIKSEEPTRELRPQRVGTPVSDEHLKKIFQEIIDDNQKIKDSRPDLPTDPDQKDYEQKGGFRSMSEFAAHVYKSRTGNPKTPEMVKWLKYCEKAPSGMSEGIGPDGGFLIPVEYRNQLFRDTIEQSVVTGRCMDIPMQVPMVNLPFVNDTSHSSNLYGGITIYRVNEGTAITGSKPAIGRLTLSLSKVALVCYLTNELLSDSPMSMEPLITSMFGEALSWWMDEDIINGTGAGQPLGVVNAPCFVTVTRTLASNIRLEDCANMLARLSNGSLANAVWLANNDCLPMLMELYATDAGTGYHLSGLSNYAVEGVAGAVPMQIFGRPLILTEHCQTLGTSGDLILGDFRKYLLGRKTPGGVETATSIHIKFLEDETTFRFTLRYDGQPRVASALTPKHSTSTLSPFVGIS